MVYRKLLQSWKAKTGVFIVLAVAWLLLTRDRWLKHRPNRKSSHAPSHLEVNSKFRHPNVNLSYSLNSLKDDLTLVTGYFNLGTFVKGEFSQEYSSSLYHQWMRIFEKIHNPLIVYLEDTEDIAYFKALRKDFENSTKIIRVSRQNMWAFSLRSRIKEIYSEPSYPKYYPNTVNPDYSCAMHAKYECVQQAVVDNPFRTKYFAWLDIGLFREVIKMKNQQDFSLSFPPNLEEDKVAYSRVGSAISWKISAADVFLRNEVWVCGAFFLAKADVMLKWTLEYMKATEYFISKKLMNSDQQVILAMHKDPEFKPAVKLQTYRGNGKYNEWFYLGYLTKEHGLTFT